MPLISPDFRNLKWRLEGPQTASGTQLGSLAERRILYFFGIAFALFLFFGGGGAPNPLPLTGLQVLAVAALALAGWHSLFVRKISLPWSPALILLATFALGLLQLVPLPISVWKDLPGREFPMAILREAGIERGWMSFSMAPEYTGASLLTLLPAAAVFVWASRSNKSEHLMFAWITLTAVLVSAFLGFMQVIFPASPSLYLSPRAIFTQPSGIFANRNFQSDFLLIGIFLTGALSRSEFARRRRFAPSAAIGVIAFLAAMVAATASRFGLVMLVPALALGLFLVGQGRWRIRAMAIAAVAIAFLFAPLMVARGLPGALSRFSFGATEDSAGELRFAAFADLIVAMQRYLPLGSGLGTFEPVYRSVESLELVGPRFFNHAHNDYIELVIETGVVGPILVALFVLALVHRAWGILRRRDTGSETTALRIAAVAGIALLLAHSAFDYPLRNVTLESVFAFLTAVVFAPRSPAAASADRPRQNRAIRLLGTAVLVIGALALAAVTVQMGLGQQTSSNGAVGYAIRPQNPRAATKAAEASLLFQKPRMAIEQATSAIAASPLNAPALRVLGMARNRIAEGSGDGALLLASQLSWRDGPTQSWVLQKAILSGQTTIAMQRTEALVRLGKGENQRNTAFALLRISAIDPESRKSLVAALAQRPVWRRDFLFNDVPMTPEQLSAMAELLQLLGRSAAPPTLGEARPVIDQLVRDKQFLKAYSLFRVVAPQGFSDSGFDKAPADYQPGTSNTPFDWRTISEQGGYASVERANGEQNQALYAQANASRTHVLAERTLVLEPGSYNLSFRQLSNEPLHPTYFVWNVRCSESQRLLAELRGAPARGAKWQFRKGRLSVPEVGCRSQKLQLISSGTPLGSTPEVYFDDVAVQ